MQACSPLARILTSLCTAHTSMSPQTGHSRTAHQPGKAHCSSFLNFPEPKQRMSWACLRAGSGQGAPKFGPGELAVVACAQAQNSPERRAAKAREDSAWGKLFERLLLQEAGEVQPQPAEPGGIPKPRVSEPHSSSKVAASCLPATLSNSLLFCKEES